MKKRIISLVVFLSMVLSFGTFASDSYNILSESGILSADFSLADEAGVSRGSFAKMAIQLIAMENMTISSPVSYSDIDSESEEGKAITTLTQLKYMSGYGDGTFRPEREMKISEAVKIIIHILGYGYRANADGGYPTGYMYTAKNLGLLSGVGGAYSDVLSFDTAMKLFYNAVDVPIAEVSGVGDNLTYSINPDNTILSVYHDMDKERGIVTAGETAALTGYYKTGKNQIRIGSNVYTVDADCNITDYLGLTVDFIYRLNKEKEEKKIVSIIPKEDNQIIEIDIKDYIGISGNSVVYEYNDSTKTKGFSKNADVIYNGQNGTINDSIIKSAENGSIKLISTKRNSEYDLIILKCYTDMIVGRIDEIKKTVYDESDAGVTLNLDDTSKTVRIFDENGQSTNFQFISRGDVLSYMDNTDYCEVYVSSKTTSGILSETGTDDDGSYIVVGDKILWLTKKAAATSACSVNENVRVFLNCFGKAAKVKTLSRDGYEFVYLIKANGAVNGPDEIVHVKLFDVENGLFTTPLKTNTVINGVLIKDITEEKLTSALGGSIEKLIGIKKTEEGEISHIITAKTLSELEAAGNDGFVLTHPLARRRYENDPPFLSRSIMLKKNTPIIQIPADVNAATDKDFKMVTPDVFVEGDGNNTEAYNTSVDYAIPEFIVYRPASGAASVPAFKYETELVVVKEKTKVLTEDGTPAVKITVQNGSSEDFFYYDGKNITATPQAGYTYGIDNLSKGDIIRFSADSDKFIGLLEVLYDYDKDLWFYNTAFTTTGYLNTTVSKVVDTYVYVPYWWEDGADTYGVFDLTEKTLSIGGVSIIQSRDNREPVVTGGTTGDVSANDRVIIHEAYGQLIGIIIIR